MSRHCKHLLYLLLRRVGNSQMESQVRYVDVQVLLSVVQVFEKIITKGFGPQGSQTLICTATGQVMTTNNGMTILNTLNINHPIGKLITESLRRLISYTGDGSKTFTLYLSEALRQIDTCSTRTDNFDKIHQHHAIKQFLENVYPNFVQNILKYCLRFRTDSAGGCHDELRENIKAIFTSVFSPHFQERVMSHFVAVALSLFPSDLRRTDLLPYIEHMVSHFHSLILKAPSCPYSDCRTVDFFIIHRDFATVCDVTIKQSINFCMCVSFLENLKSGNSTDIVNVSSEQNIRKVMNYKTFKIQKFVNMCNRQEINLILSNEKIEDFALEIFHHGGISVIHCILEEDLKFLQSLLQAEFITDISESIEDRSVCKALSCSHVLFNGKRCVQLDISGSKYNVTRMLILAAPTEGLCNELSLVFKKAIKTLLLSFTKYFYESKLTSGSEQIRTEITAKATASEIILVPAGATFELVGSMFLLKLSKSSKDAEISEICKVLGKMLLIIARTLHRNVDVSGSRTTADFLVKLKQIHVNSESSCSTQNIETEGMEFLGFTRKGFVKNLFQEGVAESLTVKLHIFCAVLELLSQLLRMDSIVGVRRLSCNESVN